MPNSDRFREHSHVFLKKLFARGIIYEQLFTKISDAGCDAEILGRLLFAACTMATYDRGEFLDPGDVSTAQLKKMTRDLLSLADLLEQVNSSRLNPKLDILSAPPDTGRDPIRKHMAYLYDKLPFIMRVYSVHLERFSKVSRAILKRMTFAHFETLRVLLYVKERTGRARYDDISNLLTAGFIAVGGSENTLPEFFSADALAKLMQRTLKFGLTSRF